MPSIGSGLTIAAAAIGAVLGVLNTWHNISRTYPRVRVRAVWYGSKQTPTGFVSIISRRAEAIADSADGCIGVEVFNTGAIPVYLRDVGFCPEGARWFSRFRELKEPAGRISLARDEDGIVVYPYKLEPGASACIRASHEAVYLPAMDNMRYAFAFTCDERLFTGKGALLKAVVAHVRSLSRAARQD